jgi:uncharacterized protein (DUF1015 family)
MPQIQPFRAVLFNSEKTGDLGGALCPPYDVISQQEQYRLYLRSPHNVVRLELGQDQPEDTRDVNRYSRAATQLDHWLADGVLREDDEPALYVYQQHWNGGSRMSFFCAVQLAEWEKREVIPHEQTLSGPKADRLLLMRHTASNLSPVYSLYEDPAGVIAAVLEEGITRKPDIEADQGGGDRHLLWRITEWDAIATVQEALSARPVYIADGHHRYETALTYRDERREAQGAFTGDEPWNYVLMCLSDMADPGLVVHPTHRLIKAEGLDAEAFIRNLGDLFEIKEFASANDAEKLVVTERILEEMADADTASASGSHRFGLILAGQNKVLKLSLKGDPVGLLADRGRSPAWSRLDVAILHYLVVDKLLGIPEAEWKGGKKIVYTRDPKEVLLGIESGEFQVGAFLNGTPVSQIRDVADAGDVMPQKSTFFYPKLPTGLVIHRLGEVPDSAEAVTAAADA